MLRCVIAGLGLLTASVGALPGSTEARDCSHDNCLRALLRYTAPASADCLSFFQTTVTPCTVTSTATITLTSTAPQITLHSTEVVTVTDYYTSTATVQAVQVNRRDAEPAAQKDKRVTALAVCPSLAVPTAVPLSASACSGAVRYSSACSCLGITGATTTLAPATVNSTSTVFVTQVPEPVTLVEKSTTTTTLTQILTTTQSPSLCSTFIAQATSGTYAGSYLVSGGQLGAITVSGPDSASASKFVLASNGQVSLFGQTAVWDVRNNAGLTAVSADDNPTADGYYLVSCSFGNPEGAADGTLGSLTCANPWGANGLGTCPVFGNLLGLGLASLLSPNGLPPCYPLNLIAIPACS